ncbi:unnamed protein product [Amoebophrya sp. A25]|nr:unnamed protein product [Amoebophrya sp. A25]|eukprot:GSA25T00007057001.1
MGLRSCLRRCCCPNPKVEERSEMRPVNANYADREALVNISSKAQGEVFTSDSDDLSNPSVKIDMGAKAGVKKRTEKVRGTVAAGQEDYSSEEEESSSDMSESSEHVFGSALRGARHHHYSTGGETAAPVKVERATTVKTGKKSVR